MKQDSVHRDSMIRQRLRAQRWVLLLLFSFTSVALAQSGWERVEGGASTTCAHGTPFFFWIHRGSPERLAFYLRGGGACWNKATCDPNGRPTYTQSIEEWETPGSGLMEMGNPLNPLHRYTVVFVPYCTGDVHLGARVVTYEGGLVIRHRGHDNVQAALDWVYRSGVDPKVVLVAGESAGSLPTPVYALTLARRYPSARVVQIGDGAGAFRMAPSLGHWGASDVLKRDAAFAGLDAAAPTYLSLYELAARAAPHLQLTQINAVDDSVQRRFLELRGNADTRVGVWMARNIGELQRSIPTFRTYFMPGTDHTVLRSRQLYTTSVEGIALKDWIARLLAGQEVEDVGEALLPNRASAARSKE